MNIYINVFIKHNKPPYITTSLHMDHQDARSGHPNVMVVRFGDTELSLYDDPVQGIWGMSYREIPSLSNATDTPEALFCSDKV